MNGVFLWYILALHHLFQFIACFVFFYFFLSLYVSFITSWGIEVSLAILVSSDTKKAVEMLLGSYVEFQGVSCYSFI